MNTPLRVLIVDDSNDDAILVVLALKREGYDLTYERVTTAADMREALAGRAWDVVIADYTVPAFGALPALALLHELQLDLPFIIMSGTIDEAMAVDALRAGAHDFVLKGKLARLAPAIAREMRDADVRRQQRQTEAALQERTDELAAMTEQLWQAAKLATLGELSASVAHELNNPLFTVSLYLKTVLAQLPPDDRQRAALEGIDEEVKRMSRLVANLLQFSRRSSRQLAPLDARDELNNTLELMAFHLRHGHIKTVTEFGPVPLIDADRQQLRQVFLNLFTNAADAMPRGGTLTVRTWTGAAAPPEAWIEVADTGDGIQPEALGRIWEPFFTTKPEGKGTGLGLGICRRIVEEHGGTIVLHSEPGIGTQARLKLPAA
jgi:two-component system, LuxR family, sensor kinase FixL